MLDARISTAPRQVADYLESLVTSPTNCLAIVWCQVTHQRRQFAAELRAECDGLPVVVHAMANEGYFDNPNMMQDDAMRLIDEHRDEVLSLSDSVVAAGVLVVVVVAASDLVIPDVSSDVPLPDWFPVRAGQVIAVSLSTTSQDLVVPINAPQFDCSSVAAALYGVDLAIVEALIRAANSGTVEFELFWGRLAEFSRDCRGLQHPIRRGDPWLDVLFDSQKRLRSVVNPNGYRPETRTFMVPSEWAMRLVTESRPIDLCKDGANLMAALGVMTLFDRHPLCMAAQVAHTASPVKSGVADQGRRLLVTLHSAGHALAMHAHSGDYGTVSPHVLLGLTRDLRDALQGYERIARSLFG